MFYNVHVQMQLLKKAFLIAGFIMISAVSYGEERNIPEFTAGIIEETDFDPTGHIIVITGRNRDYAIPDYYCGSNEMLVYEAVLIHPSKGMITSLEVGIPGIYLDEILIPMVEAWPGSRFEVIYVLDCEAGGLSADTGWHILELKKF